MCQAQLVFEAAVSTLNLLVLQSTEGSNTELPPAQRQDSNSKDVFIKGTKGTPDPQQNAQQSSKMSNMPSEHQPLAVYLHMVPPALHRASESHSNSTITPAQRQNSTSTEPSP